jgi:hypothetical protein
MPYRTFFDWAFSGNIKDPIPVGEGIPDILKYNSPIHETFLLKSFVGNGKLNFYLNTYLNNIGLRYIDKKDLFYFIKQCIIDFKINRRSVHYSKWSHDTALFKKVSKKFPLLKKDEVSILCDEIDKSDEKDSIYRTLGLDKKEFKKKKSKKKAIAKIGTKKYIAKNFGIV